MATTLSDFFSASLRLLPPLPSQSSKPSSLSISNHISAAKPSSSKPSSLYPTNKNHNKIKKNEENNISSQLRHSIESGNYAESLSLVESMCARGYHPEEHLCFDLLKALSEIPDPDGAARMVELLESEKKQNKHVYNFFIGCLCKSGRVVPAFETLGRMLSHGIHPSVNPCNSIVKGLCDHRMLDAALATVEHFRTEHRCKPNLFTYGCLIACAIVTRGIEEASILDRTALKELRLDNVNVAYMYGMVIHNLCSLRKVDEALEFVKHLPRGLGPDAMSYITLLKSFLILGKMRDAEEVIDEMLSRLHTLQRRHLRGIVRMLCENGFVEKAREMIDAAVYKFGLDADMSCCSLLVAAYLDDERLDLVIELIDFMTSIQQFPTRIVYHTMISGLCNMGHSKEAIEVLDNMRYFGVPPNSATYNRIIGGLWSNGEKKMAVRMLERMVVEGGISITETSCNLITYCMCKDGMVDEGLEVLRVMEANRFVASISPYNTILLGFCKAGRMEEAMGFFEDMLEKGFELNWDSYCIILRGAILAGYEAEVALLLTELDERKIFAKGYVASLKHHLRVNE